jgi:DNA polymerase
MKRRVLEDVRNVLLYLQAFGFERLPLEIPERVYKSEACIMREVALKELMNEIGPCSRCRLSKNRKNIVFGEGNPEAALMFIGEAPGEEEDLEGRPFVGKAGQLLTRLINRMGLSREGVYIANVVKCRPPGNRKPREDEIQSCIGFLKRQIEIISPKVIITLGDVATRALLPDTKNITRARGKTYKYDNIIVVPTFHPSYLLRNPSHKILTWNDAQLALRVLRERSQP